MSRDYMYSCLLMSYADTKVFVVDLQLQKVTSVIIRFPVCVSLFTIKRVYWVERFPLVNIY